MSPRGRIAGFGSCGALVVIGVVCAVAVPGGTGQVLTLVFIAVGLVCATSLAFLELGLSEDRDRAREEVVRRARAGMRRPLKRNRPLGRARDHPRRLGPPE